MSAMVIERIGHQGWGMPLTYERANVQRMKQMVRRSTLVDARRLVCTRQEDGGKFTAFRTGQVLRMPWPRMWVEAQLIMSDLAWMPVAYLILDESDRSYRRFVAFVSIGLPGTKPLCLGAIGCQVPMGEHEMRTNHWAAKPGYDTAMDGNALDVCFAHSAALVPYILRMLNCRNITTTAIEGVIPETSRKRLEARLGGPMRRAVRNIAIKIGGSETRVLSGPGSEDAALPLHMVRGHFKHYTEDRPLFGRLTGWYWWQAHVRGDEKHGKIGHTYELETQDEHATDA